MSPGALYSTLPLNPISVESPVLFPKLFIFLGVPSHSRSLYVYVLAGTLNL